MKMLCVGCGVLGCLVTITDWRIKITNLCKLAPVTTIILLWASDDHHVTGLNSSF